MASISKTATKSKAIMFTSGPNIDGNYGPWSSTQEFETFLSTNMGLEEPYDATTIAVKNATTGVVNKYVYEIKDGVGAWRQEDIDIDLSSLTESIDRITGDIDDINDSISGINDRVDDVEDRVDTLESKRSYTVSTTNRLLIVSDTNDNLYACSVTPYNAPNPPAVSVSGVDTDATRFISMSPSENGDQVKYSINNGSTWVNGAYYTIVANESQATTTVTVKIKSVRNGLDSTIVTKNVTVSRHLPDTTITSNGDDYSNTRTITLVNAQTSDIYYTTNGDTPTTSSTKYTSAFSIDSTKTIKTLAVKNDWQNTTNNKTVIVGTLKMYYGTSADAPTTNASITTGTSSHKAKQFGTGIQFTYTQNLAEAKAWIAYDKTLPDLVHVIETSTGYDRLGSSWAKVTVGDECSYKVYAQISKTDNNGVTFKFS